VPSHYGETWAESYDSIYGNGHDQQDCVAVLGDLADGGRALELGIGTGRIGLSLALLGVEVSGIEGSPSMLRRIQSKAGSENIRLMLGDFADVNGGGHDYKLIYIVSNTITCLTYQTEQARCICNSASSLLKGGFLVVETMNPRHSYSSCFYNRPDFDVVYVPACDHVTQQVSATIVIVGHDGGIRTFSDVSRYVWPAELDAMAKVAGLNLCERWGGWKRQPFTDSSCKCVSVYSK
jgi:SAM-dependent methyltransferase